MADTAGEFDPEAVATREELAVALQELRRRSRLTMRGLAAEADSSSSTVSGWCNGDHLPFRAQDDVFEAMLAAMGVDDVDPWLEALERVRTSDDGPGGAGPHS